MDPLTLAIMGFSIGSTLLKGIGGFISKRSAANQQDDEADIQDAQNALAEKRAREQYRTSVRDVGIQEQTGLSTLRAGYGAAGVTGGSTDVVANSLSTQANLARSDAKRQLQLGLESVSIGRMTSDLMRDAADSTRKNSWWDLFASGSAAVGQGIDLYDQFYGAGAETNA